MCRPSYTLAGLFLLTINTMVSAQVTRLDLSEVGKCSYDGSDLTEERIYTFEPSTKAEEVIRMIVDEVGLQADFVIKAGNVPNATACIIEGKRHILYSELFVEQIYNQTGDYWSQVAILAHEIGHHLNGHTLGRGESYPELELEADQFSGFVLFKMGARLEQAQAAVRALTETSGSATHPPKSARLQAIAVGYRQAREKADGGEGNQVSSQPNQETPEKDLKPEDLSKVLEDLVVTISQQDFRVPPRVQVQTIPELEDYDLYLSRDGQKYEKSKNYSNAPSGREDSLFIKYVSPSEGTEIGPLVKPGIFSAAEKETLTRKFKPSFDGLITYGDFIECSPAGCKIPGSLFCNIYASKLTFSRTKDKVEAIYDLKKCQTDNQRNMFVACITPPYDIFPIRPGMTIYCTLEYDDGDKIPFETRAYLAYDSYHQSEGNWVELSPLPGAPAGEAPFAAASFSYQFYGYKLSVFFGTGNCDDVQGFLYDTDGKGLLEVPPPRTQKNVFGIPAPANGVIQLAYDRVSGERVGPFRYSFDLDSILRASTDLGKPPRLECTKRDGKWRCVGPGYYHGPLVSWFKVKKIKFGPREDALSESREVAVTAGQVLSRSGSSSDTFGKAVSFEAPEEWTDVFYQLEFADGTKTKVLRVPLK